MTTMFWFGRPFDAPMWDDMPETPTPVGEKCGWCAEEVVEGEAGITMPYIGPVGVIRMPFHVECHMRQALGGLAHQEGRCRCHGGTDEPGEAGMTEREEARKVIEGLWGPGWMERP